MYMCTLFLFSKFDQHCNLPSMFYLPKKRVGGFVEHIRGDIEHKWETPWVGCQSIMQLTSHKMRAIWSHLIQPHIFGLPSGNGMP